MKTLVASKHGLSLPLAVRLKEEGNEVHFHTPVPLVGEGYVETIPALKGIGGYDLIVFDDAGLGKVADRLRLLGKKVVGGSAIIDRLCGDMLYGLEVIQAANIPTLPSYECKTIEEAKLIIKDSSQPLSLLAPSMLYEPTDNEELDFMLPFLVGITPGVIHLQEVKQGHRVYVGGWFNGEKFLKPIRLGFNHYKLCNGELGPKLGPMGSMVCYRTRSKLFTETLDKVELFLKSFGFVGFIELECILSEGMVYGLRWWSNLGFPLVASQDVLATSPWGSFLLNLVNHDDVPVPVETNPWCATVSICSIQWPLRKVVVPEEKGIYPVTVCKEQDVTLQCNMIRCVATVAGKGTSLTKAKDSAYELVSKVKVPEAFYRTDIGDRTLSQLKDLREWGWVK